MNLRALFQDTHAVQTLLFDGYSSFAAGIQQDRSGQSKEGKTFGTIDMIEENFLNGVPRAGTHDCTP